MIPRFPLQWPAGWPRAKQRQRAKFGKGERQYSNSPGGGSWINRKELSVADGTKRVLYELERLNVRGDDSVISTNLALRLDGLPRSDQRAPDDPGVAVYWTTRKGETKVMAIDLYDRVADNLAAVAATLEAMRAIERHGGAQILERAFTGFDALPAPEAFDPWKELGLAPGASREAIEAAFRNLSRNHHPDMPGGSTEAFQRIERARREALAA